MKIYQFIKMAVRIFPTLATNECRHLAPKQPQPASELVDTAAKNK